MSEKVLKTRVQLKYDTLENWISSTFVLKAGEVAIATITTDNSGLSNPAVGIKVGDGESTFSQLDWIQAIAGDVPNWAKDPEHEEINEAIQTAINTFSDSLNTSSTFDFSEVGLITEITTQNGKITGYKVRNIKPEDIFLDDNNLTLATKLANIDNAITQAENNAIASAAADATTKANSAQETAIATASTDASTKADAAEASAKAEATQKISELQSGLLGGATYGTDTIASVKQVATNASEKIDTKVAELQTSIGNVKQEILEELGDMTGAMRFRGTVTLDPTTSEPSITDDLGDFRPGDVLINSENTKEFIYNGSEWEELGTEGIYATKDEVNSSLDSFSGQIGALETAVNTTLPNSISAAQANAESHANSLIQGLTGTSSGSGFVSDVTQSNGKISVTKTEIKVADINDLTTTATSESEEAFVLKGYVDSTINSLGDSTSSTITTAINGLNSSVSVTEAAEDEVKVLTGVTQTNGKLTGKTEIVLAKIAQTASVEDLVQPDDIIMVFECGNASDKLYN